MANISDEERKRRLLEALPADGAAAGNTRLATELGWSTDLYFKIRNELLAEEKIEVGRGRGGSVRLSEPRKRAKPAEEPTPRERREHKLYPPFLTSLTAWAEAQGWTDRIIQQTSDQGSRRTGGRFTRPDFVVVGVKKYEYTPGVIRDVETFEVKPLGAPVDAVFEAAAHSRVATKSYLVLHTAEDDPTEDELARFESECQRFQIGLITFEDPGDYANWQYVLDPVRREPDPELLEQFVRDQVNPQNQEVIRKWMR